MQRHHPPNRKMPHHMTPPATWRVTAYDPTTNTATIDAFTTEEEARRFAGILRGRRPTWDIDIRPTRLDR